MPAQDRQFFRHFDLYTERHLVAWCREQNPHAPEVPFVRIVTYVEGLDAEEAAQLLATKSWPEIDALASA